MENVKLRNLATGDELGMKSPVWESLLAVAALDLSWPPADDAAPFGGSVMNMEVPADAGQSLATGLEYWLPDPYERPDPDLHTESEMIRTAVAFAWIAWDDNCQWLMETLLPFLRSGSFVVQPAPAYPRLAV